MLLYRQKMRLLMAKATEVLGSLIRERVPEHGPIRPVSVSYQHPSGKIRGLLCLEQDGRDPSLGRIRLGAVREGSDRMVSNYLFKGTRREVLDYLADPTQVEALIDAGEHLKEKV